MRAEPNRIARAPTTSAGLLRPGPRDPEVREEGPATHDSFGASSAGQGALSAAAPSGNPTPSLTTDRDFPGPPRHTPGRAYGLWAGEHRHSQEGEP